MNELNEYNNDKSFETSAFVVGLVSFLTMMFFPFIPTILSCVGIYCSVKANHKLYLVMNSMVLGGSLIILIATFLSIQ